MKFLKKDIGPLPVWAWGLIVIAGAGIGYLIISSQQNQSATPTDTSQTPGNASTAEQLGSNVGGSDAGPSSGGNVDTSGLVTQDQLNNAIASINQALATNATATVASTASGNSPSLVPSASPSPAASTAGSHTPADNLSAIQGYLASLHCQTSVSRLGSAGTAQSGYVVTGACVVASSLAALFGAGWQVLRCGDKYLVKGPNATKVHWGPNCTPVGYD
jgi:hypothetical protein